MVFDLVVSPFRRRPGRGSCSDRGPLLGGKQWARLELELGF